MKIIPYLAALLAGVAHAEIPLNITATDPDGDALTITAEGLPPGLTATQNGNTLTIDGTPTTEGQYPVTVRATDGEATATDTFTWTITAAPVDPEPNQAPVLGDVPDQTDQIPAVDPDPTPIDVAGVRDVVPATPALDGIYPPMSANGGARWEFQKLQYTDWFNEYAPANNGGSRTSGEAWRYDPMKALVELCRRAALVGESIPGVCQDAEDTVNDYLSRQHWGSSGDDPDCSGGITGVPRGSGTANKCDFKYGGHASALWYAKEVYGQDPYTPQQEQLMKEFCYERGWDFGWRELDDINDGFTERSGGISLQCLVDLQKAGVDTSAEREEAIGILHRSFNFEINGQVIGAPMHGINGHECQNGCSGPEWEHWMFSPWMGSAFIMPALWEHWVFLEKDPRIAEMIVTYGNTMLEYGVVNPDVWAPTSSTGAQGDWKIEDNPTDWLTLYFSLPFDKTENISRQNSQGWFSDLHNPQSIFVFNLAYFFSCDERFKTRSDEMQGFFNSANAVENQGRLFLWQHRGSASTEWLVENANCGT